MNKPTFRWLAKPTPLSHAERDLQDAQHDLLRASAHAEHYAAIEVMLESRVQRLREAVRLLATGE